MDIPYHITYSKSNKNAPDFSRAFSQQGKLTETPIQAFPFLLGNEIIAHAILITNGIAQLVQELVGLAFSPSPVFIALVHDAMGVLVGLKVHHANVGIVDKLVFVYHFLFSSISGFKGLAIGIHNVLSHLLNFTGKKDSKTNRFGQNHGNLIVTNHPCTHR
jgi:hypothetical protein